MTNLRIIECFVVVYIFLTFDKIFLSVNIVVFPSTINVTQEIFLKKNLRVPPVLDHIALLTNVVELSREKFVMFNMLDVIRALVYYQGVVVTLIKWLKIRAKVLADQLSLLAGTEYK